MADFELSSDTSGKKGFGVYSNGAWFYRAWLPAQQPLDMAYKELFPIVLACHIRGQSWSNQRIKSWCDNQSVVHILQSGTSNDKKSCIWFVRFSWLPLNLIFEHLLGKTNQIADSFSRFNLQEFFHLAPDRSSSLTCQPTRELASASHLQSLTDCTTSLLYHCLA